MYSDFSNKVTELTERLHFFLLHKKNLNCLPVDNDWGQYYETNIGVIYVKIWSIFQSSNRLTPNFNLNYAKISFIALGTGTNTMKIWNNPDKGLIATPKVNVISAKISFTVLCLVLHSL